MTPPDDVTNREGALPRDVAIAVWMADWIDDRYLDPLVGFILPGVGDLIFAVVGMYPVVIALKRRMPVIVAARMLRNVAIDLCFGAIPIVGDVFDIVFKAHRRNANLLLERHVLGPSPWQDWIAVLGAVLALLLALSVPIGLIVLAVSRLG